MAITRQQKIKVITQFCISTSKNIKIEYWNNAAMQVHFADITLATILNVIKTVVNTNKLSPNELENYYMTVCLLWDLENDRIEQQSISTVNKIYELFTKHSLTLFNLSTIIEQTLKKHEWYVRYHGKQ